MEEDRAYFIKRALEEEEAASNATCAEARWRHKELAAAYRKRTLTIESVRDGERQ